MAEEYNHDAGRTQSLDTGIALMGALGKVGEILNRPNSRTSTGSVFYSSSTTTNPAPNILGAVLEGGFDALHDQMSDRQQQEIKGIPDRPNGSELKDLFIQINLCNHLDRQGVTLAEDQLQLLPR